MTDFVTVAKVGDIPAGQGQAFAVNGRMVAVFNENGNFSAIDDFCPHMGALRDARLRAAHELLARVPAEEPRARHRGGGEQGEEGKERRGTA